MDFPEADRPTPESVGAEAASHTRGRRPWLFVLQILLLLAARFTLWAKVNQLASRRLAAAIAAADRDDPDWRLADLMAARKPVPDDENAALIVARVVAKLPENWRSSVKTKLGGAWPPGDVGRALGRLAALEAAVRMDDATADVVRAELAAHAEAVALARTLAGYDRGRHEIDVPPNPFDIPLRETFEARAVGRLLAADAAIRAQDGDLDGALDSCRAILGVGRSIGDEPIIFSSLVRVAVVQDAIDSARRALAQGEPSDEALAALQTALLRESPQTLLIQGLRGERAINNETVRRVRDAEILTFPGDGKPPNARAQAFAFRAVPFVLDTMRAEDLESMNELISIARKPRPQRAGAWEAWRANKSVRSKRPWLGPFELVPAGLTAGSESGYTNTEKAMTRYQAVLGASVILMAAERQRRRTGEWPESVGAIDHDLLSDPPIDPFSGEPFRIERRDGRFLVHSVGPNLKDERGAFEAKRWLDGGPDDVGTGAWDPPLRGRPASE